MTEILNKVFELCVKVLVKISSLLGTDYRTVKLVIFFVIIPAAFVVLLAMYYNAMHDVKRYKKLYEKFVQDDLKNF
jgi:hypothetical protein